MGRAVSFGLSLAVACAQVACGESPAPEPKTPISETRATPQVKAPEVLVGGKLRRSAVRAALREGLGAFLQNVELEDQPVFVAGKFHGFRIANLREPSRWRGVDIAPGDVITAVNGFGIEKPDDALKAFSSLEVASELHVALERQGQPRELRIAILDD